MNQKQDFPKGNIATGVIIAVLLVILIVGGFMYMQRAQAPVVDDSEESMMYDDDSMMEDDGAMNDVAGTMEEGSMMEDDETMVGGDAMVDTVTVEVGGQNFSFDPSEIRVKQGQKVKIVFTSVSGFHDWVIDEFDARTPQIQTGETATVEFVADKAGTFEYYCSVGKHRENGMVGNLIIE